MEHGSAALREWSHVTGPAAGDIFDAGCALTQQEKLWEITELVRVRIASTGVTLQRLAELDYGVDGQERQGLERSRGQRLMWLRESTAAYAARGRRRHWPA